MQKAFKEFKDFALKGNVLDLAIGVIIGGAFGKIVNSLVNDIIMPILGMIIGGVELTKLTFPLPSLSGSTKPPVLKYGSFLQMIVEFLIISASIFVFTKLIAKLRKLAEKREEEATAAAVPAKPPRQEELLEEIRDLLKEQAKK